MFTEFSRVRNGRAAVVCSALLTLLVASAVPLACLSDADLHIECDAGSGCIDGFTCTYGVCVRAVDPVCRNGEQLCDGTCVSIDDPKHCGECFAACTGGPQQDAVCIEGACRRTCASGHYDVDPVAPGCEYACTPTSPSAETCDGVDNDCDGKVDAADDDLLTPACANQTGVCEGTRQRCVDGNTRACTPDEYAEQAGASYLENEVWCDGADNDCDGQTDEYCCSVGEPPFERIADGDGWVVAGFTDDGGTVHLLAFDTEADELVTFRVDRLGAAERVSSAAALTCPARQLTDVALADDQGTLVAVCSESRSGVGILHTGADTLDQLAATETGTYVTGLSADRDGSAVVAAMRLDGATSGTLLARDDTARLVRPFEPPVGEHGGASIAFDATGTAVLSFLVPTAGEVRRQPLTESLEPRDFARELAGPFEWDDATPLATATADPSGGYFVAHPGDDGALILSHGTEDEPELTELSPNPALRVAARSVRGDGARLVTGVFDDGIGAWLWNGEVYREWFLPLAETSRDTPVPTPARPIAYAEEDVLYVAYGAPADVDADQPGLFLHRLGPNGSPLCTHAR